MNCFLATCKRYPIHSTCMVQHVNSVELNEADLDDTEQTRTCTGINNLPSRLALAWCGCAHGSNNHGMVWHGMA